MLNKAILQGRLVADPELRHTQTGVAVATFRIACNRDFKSKDPNAQNADFISVVAWQQTAEFISRYFTKGSMILVDGRIQTRDYTDNSGQRRFVVEVVADRVNFCGYDQQNQQNQRPQQAQSYAPAEAQTAADPYAATAQSQGTFRQADFVELDDDGELPF